VKPVEDFRRHVVHAIDYRGRARIGCARLALLVLGERHRAEREDFVDFSRVVKIAGTFGRDLRIVVKNDRRRQHHVTVALVANHHRPGADVRASLHGALRPLRRIDQRYKLAAFGLEQRVDPEHRRSHYDVARGGRVMPQSYVLDLQAESTQRARFLDGLRKQANRSLEGGTFADEPADSPSRPSDDRFGRTGCGKFEFDQMFASRRFR